MTRLYKLPVLLENCKNSVENMVLNGKSGQTKDNGIVLHLETKTFFRYKLRTYKAKHYCYQILMRLTTITTFTVTGMIKLSSYINELKKRVGIFVKYLCLWA